MASHRILGLTQAVICCFLAGVSQSPAWGQGFPGGSGMEVSVVMHCETQPALGERFVEALEDRAVFMLRSMLGSGAKVDLLRLPNLSRWLERHTLDDLTPKQCRDFGCDQTEKTVLLCVRYAHGAFFLSGAEYDRHFDAYGPVHKSRIVQRSMAEDAIGRLAMKCWTPIGKINSVRDDQFSIGFSNLARLKSLSNWSNLKKGAVLQVYREIFNGTEIQQAAHPTQYLTITDVSEVGTSAKPIGKDWDVNWFGQLNDSRARYLVRRVTPRKGQAKIKVMLSGIIPEQPNVFVPRGGCDVYVRDQLPDGPSLPGASSGVTDRQGIATVRIDSDKPVFVTVAYESLQSTLTIVPGITPEPLEFRFQYQGNRSDHVTSLNWIGDQLRAKSSNINRIISTINDTANQGDAANIRKQAETALALAESRDLLDKMESIEKRAVSEGIDVSGQVNNIQTVADQLKQNTLALKEKLRGAEMFAAAERNLSDFQSLFDKRDWTGALAAMEKFAERFPDHEQVAKLPAFRQAVVPKDKAHADARAFLMSSIGMSRSDTLMKRWDQLRDSLDLLLKHDDQLYLATVQAEIDNWANLLNKEIREITAVDVNKLSKVDGEKLKARGKKANQVKNDFIRLRPLILAVAEKSKQLLSP